MLGRLSQAQQMAATLNKTVEVRFYKYTDLEVNYLGPQFFSYQFLVLDTKTKSDNSFTEVLRPLGAPMEIGNSTLICSTKIKEADASPLLAKENLIDDGTGSAESPKFFLKAKAQYVALRFSPDGKVRRLTKQMADSMSVSEELLLPDAYLTVVPSNKADGGNAVPNYYSIQVDPYGGHARFYQPVP